ncbi:hypothetical protein B0H14DRAFT_2567219 [Mycena olivaceomarginata]|nr:hypothetical protein B0H14DRAFT_2567219 [Mycena olivaceomarginata]
MMLSPQPEKAVMEESRPATTIPATRARDVSPSEGSVVSLGPEEDGEMEDVEKKGTPAREDETTYVLIHGHSFAFGLGDLRLWLRHPNTTVETASIAGIYRLLQSDYRVDYFFEVRNAGDAALLLSAGERNARSSGARYLSREGFERATSGLQRYGVESTPPPEVPVKERAKLPNFRRNVPPEAPQDTRPPVPITKGPGGIAGENSHDRRPPGLGNAFVEVPPLPGIEAEVLPRLACEERDPRAHLMTDPMNVDDLPRDTLNLARGGVLRSTTDDLLRGAPVHGHENATRARPRLSDGTRLHEEERTPDDWKVRSPNYVGSSAPNAAYRTPGGTSSRSCSAALGPDASSTRSTVGSQEALAGAFANTARQREARLNGANGAPKGHRRAHNRPKKRLERILRWEEEMRLEWEEFRWTDAEIDWIINQEELLPSLEDEEADDRMNED